VFTKIVVYFASLTLLLSGCVTDLGLDRISIPDVGPKVSSFFNLKSNEPLDPGKPKLDIVIPVFDPGLPEDPSKYKDEGIWPELRRAEAYRFAFKLKSALEETGAFGAVRVAPDETATGDLYIIGKIAESDGEDVEIDLDVVDISGDQWFVSGGAIMVH